MLHRAREALRQCLPDQLKDNTFSSCMKDDNATKRWLMQLQQNLEAPGIPDPRSMPLSWSRSRSTYVHNSVMWKVEIRTYGTCKESEGSERFECWIMRFLDVDKLLFCMCEKDLTLECFHSVSEPKNICRKERWRINWFNDALLQQRNFFFVYFYRMKKNMNMYIYNTRVVIFMTYKMLISLCRDHSVMFDCISSMQKLWLKFYQTLQIYCWIVKKSQVLLQIREFWVLKFSSEILAMFV